MSIYIISAIEHYFERLVLNSQSSPWLTSSLETIDAALWLIAGERIAQSLSLFHNAIELMLKSELARVNPVLIADLNKFDYKNLKMILREDFLKHPKSTLMNLPNFDIDKTISFTEALSRVGELYESLVRKWRTPLGELQDQRNGIVHFGSTKQDLDRYSNTIVTVALPFIEEFLWEVRQISLEKLILKEVYREYRVADQVCRCLMSQKSQPGEYVLKTLAKEVLVINSEYLSDDDGERDFELAERKWGRSFRRGFTDWTVQSICRLCSGIVLVKVNPIKNPERKLIPLAVECSKCKLSISENDRYLAEYHFGEIDKPTADEFWQENEDLVD